MASTDDLTLVDESSSGSGTGSTKHMHQHAPYDPYASSNLDIVDDDFYGGMRSGPVSGSKFRENLAYSPPTKPKTVRFASAPVVSRPTMQPPPLPPRRYASSTLPARSNWAALSDSSGSSSSLPMAPMSPPRPIYNRQQFSPQRRDQHLPPLSRFTERSAPCPVFVQPPDYQPSSRVPKIFQAQAQVTPSTPDNVDWLDATSPFGRAHHHASPYDVVQQARLDAELPPLPRIEPHNSPRPMRPQLGVLQASTNFDRQRVERPFSMSSIEFHDERPIASDPSPLHEKKRGLLRKRTLPQNLTSPPPPASRPLPVEPRRKLSKRKI
ncbi:hypothetical protein SISNIDRAFT_483322 [Sistotremastrum niveocremeum HHB9708]|uniref:Uncharacterized protein n=1 Tax=Sistotremastrum niveocremeum HHB9708 TaxID=1314777 RepID=A0A164XER1_9AGAM|nr:hypothetical protein SISNIDRAFT_483322 [Sistotremastrum niveocremeum HHB9708]